jgi:hypothetical protein
MNVNGYGLREAIREWTVKKELAEQAFNKSLYVFPGDKGSDPNEVWGEYRAAELNIAKLQSAQNEYNLKVTVAIGGENITLCEAVKRVGAISRFVTLWKKALSKEAMEKHAWESKSALIRNKDDIVAEKKVTDETCQKAIVDLKKSENVLRAAIATANAIFIELTLDAGLL